MEVTDGTKSLAASVSARLLRSTLIPVAIAWAISLPVQNPLLAQAQVLAPASDRLPELASISRSTLIDTVPHAARAFDESRMSWCDPLIGAGFAAAALLAAPQDIAWARRARQRTSQQNSTFHSLARVRVVGDPGAIIITAGMYGIGRIAHNAELADVGLHSAEAVLVAGGISVVLKGLGGRARPYAVADSNSSDFRFGRGFSDNRYASMPSGHATVAFAAAAALTSEAAAHHVAATPYIGIASYGVATLVAASRVYDDKHWTSDVIVGAGIGTLSGILVVRATHRHPSNRIDRWLLGMTLIPSPAGGLALRWSAHGTGISVAH